MLDIILVLTLLLIAVCSSVLAWVPLPAIAAAGAIVPADAGLTWLPVVLAGVHGRGCRADQRRSLDGSNRAGPTARRRRSGDEPITVSENRS